MVKWLLVLMVLTLACTTHGKPDWVEGGLYSTQNEDGGVAIVKVLKVDDLGVHVRVFSNRFDSHPTQLDETKLYLAGSSGRGHCLASA
jgi:hypothetical protein